MASSKRRPEWADLPQSGQAAVETAICGPVVHAAPRTGGFSPCFAAVVTRSDGQQMFVKAMDAHGWPDQARLYRDEIVVATQLPTGLPVPRLLDCHDDEEWVVLAFEAAAGAEPTQPWTPTVLTRVLVTLAQVREADVRDVSVPDDWPRLGGWQTITNDPVAVSALADVSPWAAANLPSLRELESTGVSVARAGTSLVHSDLYTHNILVAGEQVSFVDWPNARIGDPMVDLITVLAGAARDGWDVDRYARAAGWELDGTVEPILAAHAGFCIAGALEPALPGLEPIIEAKRVLGLNYTRWLQTRLT